MARNKLQVFTDFANMLLPHETAYLLSCQQMVDLDKLSILERVHQNCTQINQFTPYNSSLDKRKYSNLKNWILKRLEAIDVDQAFEWMIEMERQIMTDSIDPEEERQLLRLIKQYKHPTFFFVKFYELVKAYRHFILIRLRYGDYSVVDQFLSRFAGPYKEACRIDEQLHEATRDITQQYAANTTESIQWERWLRATFFDESLDGHNRYMAFVRLSFIAFNYRKFDLLWEAMDYLDEHFVKGEFYSKRILLNYYHLRMMLHAKVGDAEEAIRCGFLSIRGKNNDYLFYANNLSAVLLRSGRAQEALQVMKNAAPEMKRTKNFHNKIGYVAFYVQSLIKNQLIRNAVSYCKSFLIAYEKEIFQYRWHTFFSAYLEALLLRGNYQEMLLLEQRYDLLQKDSQYQKRSDYTPSISWYLYSAKYKLDQLSKDDFQNLLQSFFQTHKSLHQQKNAVDALMHTLRQIAPEVVNYLGFRYRFGA